MESGEERVGRTRRRIEVQRKGGKRRRGEDGEVTRAEKIDDRRHWCT